MRAILGRVLVPLAAVCGYVHGIDLSEAMVGICREKLKKAGVGANRAPVGIGDITQFSLGRTFDLILAPYRVFQNLESELAVNGVFECVRQHLAPEGTCIFNVFNPKCDPDTLRRDWCTESETLSWEVPVEGGRVTCHDRRPRMDPTNLILYPELIYRRYEGEKLMDEVLLKIAMRCYYPEHFVQLIARNGFRVLKCWGGYTGEPYGRGPELVVQFAEDR